MTDRRRFLRNCSIALPGWLFLPGFLSSCKEKDWIGDSSFSGKVAIIGAGAAGMYAAYLLQQRGIEVIVLEASSQWGGRIRPLTGFSDFTIELGAEEIRGSHSVLYDLVRSTGAAFAEGPATDFFSLDGVLLSEGEMNGVPEYTSMKGLIEGLSEYNGPDTSALIYGNSQGLTERVRHIFNAQVGNENGTSISRIGMAGLQRQESQWAAGSDRYLLRYTHILGLLESRFSPALPYIRLNTPVTSVDYTGSRIALATDTDEIIEADQVIVTVPHRVLYDQSIAFFPALPASHQNAINRIRTDKGLKIILQFSSRFWSADADSIYGAGYIPRFRSAGWGGRSASNRVLTAEVNGEHAEFLSALSESEMIAIALDELDGLFEGMASSLYESHYIMNWGNEPWIHGTVSYEPPGAGNAREILAAPVSGKIHFAGEATHFDGHAGTIHGSMETAVRAVTHILQS